MMCEWKVSDNSKLSDYSILTLYIQLYINRARHRLAQHRSVAEAVYSKLVERSNDALFWWAHLTSAVGIKSWPVLGGHLSPMQWAILRQRIHWIQQRNVCVYVAILVLAIGTRQDCDTMRLQENGFNCTQ